MAIPTTNALAVKQYLFTTIKTTLATDIDANLAVPEAPKVIYNDYGVDLEPDMVMVGKISQAQHPGQFVGGGGAGWLAEEFTVHGQILVARGGDDMMASEIRAWHIINVIDAALRADPSFGGLVQEGVITKQDAETGWSEDDLGVITELDFEVTCKNESIQ